MACHGMAWHGMVWYGIYAEIERVRIYFVNTHDYMRIQVLYSQLTCTAHRAGQLKTK